MDRSILVIDHRTGMGEEEKKAAGSKGQVQLVMRESNKSEKSVFFDTKKAANAAGQEWLNGTYSAEEGG